MEFTVAGTVPDSHRIPFYAADERLRDITYAVAKISLKAFCKKEYAEKLFQRDMFYTFASAESCE